MTENSGLSFDPHTWERLAKECLLADSFRYVWGYEYPIAVAPAWVLRNDSVGVEISFSDPILRIGSQKRHGRSFEDMSTAAADWAHITFPGLTHGWADLPFCRQHWDWPIALKDIQTAEYVKLAVQHGMQGGVESNHGSGQ